MDLSEVPSVQARRQERLLVKAAALVKALAAWKGATQDQKTGIRFGMTDIELIRQAGYDPYKGGEELKEFHLALMELASNNGGMRA